MSEPSNSSFDVGYEENKLNHQSCKIDVNTLRVISFADLRSKERKGFACEGTERTMGDGGETGRLLCIACSSSEMVWRVLRLKSRLNTGDLGDESTVRSFDLARPNVGDMASGIEIDGTFMVISTGALSNVNVSFASS